jgi:carbonic anhydrase/acetyltransferase-like protein (isoleucine patch superfamily)
VLDDCEIGCRCIIAAGTLLPPGTIVPDGTVMMGVPGQRVREVTDQDLEMITHVVRSYVELGRQYAAGRFPNIAAS